MYWRLTSKEKPVGQEEIKVIIAYRYDKSKNTEDVKHIICYYYVNDNSWRNPFYVYNEPYCWSYIDELPSEEE